MFAWNEWLIFLTCVPLSQLITGRFFVHDPPRVALVRSWWVASAWCGLIAVVSFEGPRLGPALMTMAGALVVCLIARFLMLRRA